MNIKDEHIDGVCMLLEQLVGNVTSKNLFTGYGLFHKEDTMFAVWQKKTLYLRAEGELADKLVRLGCVPFTTNELNKRFVLSQYYALSELILRDNRLCRSVIIRSIKQIQHNKNEQLLKKMKRLKELANLTIKHEKALQKVGIPDVETFRTMGAEETMVRLKQQGSGATLEFYWKLVGACKIKIAKCSHGQKRKPR